MFIEVTIGLSVVLLTVSYIYYKYVLFNFWRKRGVFCPEPVVPVGNLAEYVMGKITISKLLHNLYLDYKEHRIFGMYMFFRPHMLVTDPDLIRLVLTKEFASFQDRGMFYNEKTDPLTYNLVLLPGKKWRKLRTKMTPTFTSGKVKQMFAILIESGEDMSNSLENVARAGGNIEVKELFARYTTDVIMSTAFGIKSNCITEGDNEYRYWGKKFFEMNPVWNAMFLFAPQILNFFSLPILHRGITKFFSTIFRNNVEYRKKHNIVRHDFMNLLMQLMDKGYVENDEDNDTDQDSSNTSKLSIMEAAAQAYIFFLAGFETSSTAATFCLYELAQNQDIQDKLRREIDEVLEQHNGLTYDAVNEMPYLHKVLQESMRKYPPVGGLIRKCTKEMVLPTTNVRVPEGISVIISTFGLHRDPAIYPDPETFDPERFNTEQVAARHPYTYLPFGEGPRYCIGAKLGYLQAKIGIINLITKFKFKLHSRTPVPIVFNKSALLTTPKSGIHVIIELR